VSSPEEMGNMANMDVRAWRQSEILSHAPTSTPIESDDGFEFPPLAHPFRELVTFSMFALGIVTLVVWGGSKLL
jgi:hypothetical protein